MAAVGGDGGAVGVGQVGVGIGSIVKDVDGSVGVCWVHCFLADQLEDVGERESVEAHDQEIGEEPSGSGDLAHLAVGVGQETSGHQMVIEFSGLPGHDVYFGFFVGQGKGRVDVGSDANAQHEDVGKGKGDLQSDQSHEWPDFGHVGGQQVHDGFLQVVEYFSAFFDTIDDGSEIVVEQDHVGGVLGYVRSRDSHGNADISLLDGG